MTELSSRLSSYTAKQRGHTFLSLCSNLVINLCFPTYRPFLKAAGSIHQSMWRWVAVSYGTSKGVPSAAKPVGWEVWVAGIWTENLSGWNLCILQLLSPLCALISTWRKLEVHWAGPVMPPNKCQSQCVMCQGPHHLLECLQPWLLPLILGGLLQNAD